jgi:hypothetical protein
MLWFLGAICKHAPKFQRRWFGPYRIQYCLPNNIVLLVTIDKFNPNKLKPYKFIEDRTLQPVLTKPNDLVNDELVQTKELEPLPIGLDDFHLVEFEPVNNHMTHGNIIGTNVPIEDNNVMFCNDQNDAFSGTFIDVYSLEVYNPKRTHLLITTRLSLVETI